MPKNAIIIGAGPAGLTAAYELLKNTHYHPVVLEASKEIGGISKTVTYKGNRMDIGGHRFFSKNDSVMKMWEEIMPVQGAASLDDKILKRERVYPAGGPDPEKEDNVMLIRTRVSRIYYRHRFFDYPISLKPQTFLNMGFGNSVNAGIGYIHSSLSKREENTLQDFMINRFGEPLYKMFFEDYTEKVWGRKPSEISASWGEQRIRGLSLRKMILTILKKPFLGKQSADQKETEASLIEQFWYPKKGPGQLWETLADTVRTLGGEIRLGCEVVGINSEGGKISSLTVRQQDGEKNIAGDVFLSSMPLSDLARAMGNNMPADVKKIALDLPYRDFITVGLLVKKLALENHTKMKTISNIVPDCWIYVQEKDVKLGRLQIFNNWSPYMVNDVENTVWIGLEYFCNEGDDLWEKSNSDFIRFATQELCKIGIIDCDDVLDATMQKVKKAYPAYFGSYAQIGKVQNFLNTIDNLYCIGRNGQHRYNNMDHSMLTAMTAVKLIRSDSKDKTELWNVNTERQYQEEK